MRWRPFSTALLAEKQFWKSWLLENLAPCLVSGHQCHRWGTVEMAVRAAVRSSNFIVSAVETVLWPQNQKNAGESIPIELIMVLLCYSLGLLSELDSQVRSTIAGAQFVTVVSNSIKVNGLWKLYRIFYVLYGSEIWSLNQKFYFIFFCQWS